jgi:cytochrome P450 family 144
LPPGALTSLRERARNESLEHLQLGAGVGAGPKSIKGAHFCVGAALAQLEAQIVLGMLLDRTSWIEAADVGLWLPSILVRRLERLELTVT